MEGTLGGIELNTTSNEEASKDTIVPESELVELQLEDEHVAISNKLCTDNIKEKDQWEFRDNDFEAHDSSIIGCTTDKFISVSFVDRVEEVDNSPRSICQDLVNLGIGVKRCGRKEKPKWYIILLILN